MSREYSKLMVTFAGMALLGSLSVQMSAQAAEKQLSPHSTANEKFLKGRILVQPRAGVTERDLAKALAAHGGKSVSKIEGINVHIVELPENANEKAIAALLNHNPKFQFAEVDGVLTPAMIPNDPSFSASWHHPVMGTAAAWDIADGTGVTIAIVDTGVDGAHPDLASHMVPGYNFYDNNSDASDVQGHGTKVAGSAAAIGNNAAGITGVAWNSQIMPIRVASPTAEAYYSTIASGISYAASHGARIATASFTNISASSSVISAANQMNLKGGLVFGSYGNSGALDPVPATASVIIVTATDSADNRASFSTYGPSADLAAPGVGIYVTTRGGGYGTASGTSFSAPMTAAVAALMINANPNLSAAQLQNILFSTSVDRGEPGWDQYYGHGRVNAEAAVRAAKNTVAGDTQAPTVAISSPSSGSIVKGAVAIDVAASDNIGVARVELYAGGSLVASSSVAPFGFSWNTASRPDGAVALVAKAFDSAGNVGSSSAVNVTIDNVIDTTAPVVRITSPAAGAVVRKNVSISASATDNEGVASISVYVDNVLKGTAAAPSISINWNASKSSVGAHTIRVDARDTSGNVSSASVQVTK